MQITDNKYLVFKPEELLQFMGQFLPREGDCAPVAQEMTEGLEKIMLSDAEVIRHQDITAAPIFWHYSQQIHTLIDMADRLKLLLPDREGLMKIAEHFGMAAHKAENAEFKKLPD